LQKTVENTREGDKDCTYLTTLGESTQIGTFILVSLCPRKPRKAQYVILQAVLPKKLHQCKGAFILMKFFKESSAIAIASTCIGHLGNMTQAEPNLFVSWKPR